jgi:uncharacterized protein YecE (DUF72 family)
MPRMETFREWARQTPDDFTFSVKASRFITHMKKLKDVEQSIDWLLDNASGLGKKLGPILFQLPPGWKLNTDRLESFLNILPADHRFAIEFRNPTWYNEQVYALLTKYNCAFCIYELDVHRSPIMITADFAYVRLHGPGGKYQGSYAGEVLQQWVNSIKLWVGNGKDVYVYFDNDDSGYAAANALSLKLLLLPESKP